MVVQSQRRVIMKMNQRFDDMQTQLAHLADEKVHTKLLLNKFADSAKELFAGTTSATTIPALTPSASTTTIMPLQREMVAEKYEMSRLKIPADKEPTNILFLGESGAGKSTIFKQFVNFGRTVSAAERNQYRSVICKYIKENFLRLWQALESKGLDYPFYNMDFPTTVTMY
jgi:transcriptional regulator with PAS, ATPase and Fis domain